MSKFGINETTMRWMQQHKRLVFNALLKSEFHRFIAKSFYAAAPST